jgi:hypothetical protein
VVRHQALFAPMRGPVFKRCWDDMGTVVYREPDEVETVDTTPGAQGLPCTHTFSTVNTAFVPPNANELESAIRREIFPRPAPAT